MSPYTQCFVCFASAYLVDHLPRLDREAKGNHGNGYPALDGSLTHLLSNIMSPYPPFVKAFFVYILVKTDSNSDQLPNGDPLTTHGLSWPAGVTLHRLQSIPVDPHF